MTTNQSPEIDMNETVDKSMDTTVDKTIVKNIQHNHGRTSPYGPEVKTGSSRRGFASMNAAAQREIASKGGKAAHAKGTAHEFTSEEARAAGRKGGQH